MRVTAVAAWLAAVPLFLQVGACAGSDAPEVGSSATPTSSAATTSTSLSETRTYDSEVGGGFSFSYPSTWRASTPATGFIEVIIAAPSGGGDAFVPNINVVIEPLRINLDTEAYLEASLS